MEDKKLLTRYKSVAALEIVTLNPVLIVFSILSLRAKRIRCGVAAFFITLVMVIGSAVGVITGLINYSQLSGTGTAVLVPLFQTILCGIMAVVEGYLLVLINKGDTGEKFIKINKRDAMPFWKSWLIRIGAVLASLIVCSVVIVLLTGDNPLEIYRTMFEGAVGTARRFWGLLQGVAMLLCVSLAVTPAFKMRFWNIGAEGQVLMGGLGAAAVMILFGRTLPAPVVLLLVIVVSILAGAIWAVIPAVFKAFWNTNETLFTLMMNYIAIQIVSYFTYIWSSNKGNNVINTINADTHAGWIGLPSSIDKYGYMLNIIIVGALTVALYFYLKNSKQGYEIAVVGESENTAKYIGINVKKVIIRTMILSGALCGVAGMLLVSGTDHTITPNTAAGRGFTAIMVSWLAKFNPFFMILTSFLLVFMQKGANEISTVFGLNNSFSEIITGIIIFFIIGSEFFINYVVKFRNAKGASAK